MVTLDQFHILTMPKSGIAVDMRAPFPERPGWYSGETPRDSLPQGPVQVVHSARSQSGQAHHDQIPANLLRTPSVDRAGHLLAIYPRSAHQYGYRWYESRHAYVIQSSNFRRDCVRIQKSLTYSNLIRQTSSRHPDGR